MLTDKNWIVALFEDISPWHVATLLGVILVLASFGLELAGQHLVVEQRHEDRAFFGGIFFILLGIALRWYRRHMESKHACELEPDPDE